MPEKLFVRPCVVCRADVYTRCIHEHDRDAAEELALLEDSLRPRKSIVPRRISTPMPPVGATCTLKLPCDNQWHSPKHQELRFELRSIYARECEPAGMPLDPRCTLALQVGYLIVFDDMPLWVLAAGYHLPVPAKHNHGDYFRVRFNGVVPGRTLEIFSAVVVHS